MPKRVREETRNVKLDQIPDQAQEWIPSVVRDEDLQLLVDRGFLPPKELAQWKSAYKNPFPSEKAGETIVYASFFERGLGLPASKFLRGLLYFYKIELVHLNPNGLSQIAFFVHMCEAFLGIDPHFQLFRYFFRLKPNPDWENPNICGGAVFQLRQDKKQEYFVVPLKDPKRTWRSEWFIIRNKVSQLPERTRRKPVFSDLWIAPPTIGRASGSRIGIPQLVGMIAELKRKGLTGVGIAYSFIKRRIQPLQERSVPGYQYKGPEDPSRLKKEDLTHDEILERLQIFCGRFNSKPKTPPQYSAGKSPQPEHIASYYSPAPLPGHLTADQTENRVQAAAIREEEARGKGLAHQSDSEEPAEEELQASVHMKRIVERKVRASQVATSKSTHIPNLPGAEPAHASAPPLPEPAASSTETHPEATLAEKVGITEAEDELTQMLEVQKKLYDTTKSFAEQLKQNSELLKKVNQLFSQAKSAEAKLAEEQQRSANHLAAVADLQEQVDSLKKKGTELSASLKERAQAEARFKGELTNCKNLLENAQDQLDQALQREETLKGQLELERNTCKLADSQLDAGVQRIQDLSARLEKAETENEEIKAVATKILRVVSESFETQASKPFLDQLRELPNLIRVYLNKKARDCTSQVLRSVKAFYPNLDLTPVGEGMQEDCPRQEFAGHVAAMEPVADRLMKSLNM